MERSTAFLQISVACLAKVAIPDLKKVKIGPKTIDCIFIGYAENSSAYRFLVHKSDKSEVHVNTIIESRNPSFLKNIFPCKSAQVIIIPKRTHDIAFDNILELVEENQGGQFEEQARRSKRARVEKCFGPDFLTFLLEK